MVDPPQRGTPLVKGSPARFAGTIELVAGVRIADRYRIERPLGEGGTSTVLACLDEHTRRPVALKLLRAPAPKEAERLIREARILAALESEHITRLVDSGMLESGEPYLVTELVDGQDLAAVLGQRGRLPVREACDIVVQACLALEEAHAKGIVHRDIKPGNVLVTRRADGTLLVKLVDFGISRSVAAKADDGTLTESNELLGTPRYMSLEQIKDPRCADARADIFSLGALLYRLLSGRYAFHGETAAEVIINIASLPAPSLLEARPDAPAALDAIVRKCLAKSADARVQTAAELRKLIAATVAELGDSADVTVTEPVAPAFARPDPLGEASTVDARERTATLQMPRPSPAAPAALPTQDASAPASGATLPSPPTVPRRRGATLALLGGGLLVVAAAFVVDRAARRGHEPAPPLAAAATTPIVVASSELPAQKLSSATPGPAPDPAPALAPPVSTGPSPRPGRPVRAQVKGRPGAPAAPGSPPSPTEFDVDVDTSSRQ